LLRLWAGLGVATALNAGVGVGAGQECGLRYADFLLRLRQCRGCLGESWAVGKGELQGLIECRGFEDLPPLSGEIGADFEGLVWKGR
jgi:hypothetical protein